MKMKLIDSKGNLILEREKPQAKPTRFSPMLNTRSIKKTHRPALVSQTEFFKHIVKKTDHGDL